MIKSFYISLFLLLPAIVVALTGEIHGIVKDKEGQPMFLASVFHPESGKSALTNDKGEFQIIDVEHGDHKIIIHFAGYEEVELDVALFSDRESVEITLKPSSIALKQFTVSVHKPNEFGITYMNSIEGTAIYASKKNEVILLDDVAGNLATNNSRQVYSKVTGLNIWESDGAGLQLGIGGRGLSPNRTSNFNTRQNGYDISADALGYPESYYSPPSEGVERIEIIRGAASLQYGTQFGGVVNFVMKKGGLKPIESTVRQTVGSFGLSNTFASVGGTKGRTSYYGFVQHKFGDGWRQNSQFNATTAFASVTHHIGAKARLGLEVTHLNYLAKQAGGLTDKQFRLNPQLSSRNRNWFKVDWNLAAATFDYAFSDKTTLSSKVFGLYAGRNALGELGRIDRPDPMDERDLISGVFKNIGNETKLLHRYTIKDSIPSVFLIGVRYYNGTTTSLQGLATNGEQANFNYLDNTLLASDYTFNNINYANFVENVFFLSDRFSVTPGARFEYIETHVNGSYNSNVLHPLTKEVLMTISEDEKTVSKRAIVLGGIGASYKTKKGIEVYANFSQNYRAINFSDVKIVNPNFRVDNDMKDESGFNADLGVRGMIKNFLTFEATGFYLKYNNRIGAILKKDEETYQSYRLRTNVGNARNIGIETFVELDIIKAFKQKSKFSWSVFSNTAVIDAAYTSTLDPSIEEGNKVELVPELNVKTGSSVGYNKLKISYQCTYVTEQFTEATNAINPVATAIEGQIPAYMVMDLSANYTYKRYKIETGVNNLMNNMYYTRRATGYPGPGIIPSDGRSFYLTLQVKI